MATVGMPSPMAEGYQAALQRATDADLFEGEPGFFARQATEQTLIDAADTLRGDEPDRFVALYAEVTAVAALSRARYQEPPLDREQLASFREILAGFLNSWVHRHGEG